LNKKSIIPSDESIYSEIWFIRELVEYWYKGKKVFTFVSGSVNSQERKKDGKRKANPD